MCCRPQSINAQSPNHTVSPAARFGAYSCDVPYDLMLSALQAIPVLTGINGTNDLAYTIYTGDLVSHESDEQLSEDYIRYTEAAIFSLFKTYLGGQNGSAPIYATLGNHDTYPTAFNAPAGVGPQYLQDSYNWDYDFVSSLWQG